MAILIYCICLGENCFVDCLDCNPRKYRTEVLIFVKVNSYFAVDSAKSACFLGPLRKSEGYIREQEYWCDTAEHTGKRGGD